MNEQAVLCALSDLREDERGGANSHKNGYVSVCERVLVVVVVVCVGGRVACGWFRTVHTH